jgi:hypothetical protein
MYTYPHIFCQLRWDMRLHFFVGGKGYTASYIVIGDLVINNNMKHVIPNNQDVFPSTSGNNKRPIYVDVMLARG